jgi:valyl-tRNA synthetase
MKSFDPGAIEKKWYQYWEENGLFSRSGIGDAFSITIPPPNVTGTLHMGHAFQATVIDTLLRYHRMSGYDTLGQPGTDHAGIATQMVVERQLAAEGRSRHDLGREAFVKRVWQWKEQSGQTITTQLRRMGLSVDWSRERFTMDERLSPIVRDVFVQLYEEGLIYRGRRLVNWDPVLRTAISDLEVSKTEESGFLWSIRYPVVGSEEYVTVATTRPETMLGDVAIAVHPDDERYRHFIGRQVSLPLAGREIPVIADSYVDPAFGTGCLKITPAHDFDDYAVGQRHNLPLINILTADAGLNDIVPAAYRGLDRFAARQKIVADLEAMGLLAGVAPHLQAVPRGDRSGAVIEPYLTYQWFVKTEPLAGPAMEAVRDGRVRLVPKNWENTYFAWMGEIRDWCISRQIWWGHRIPAWYSEAGDVYVARSENEARAKFALPADLPLRQDEDVLDTWFSSALWPFTTLGWPNQSSELQAFYPTTVMVTAFDILFFWVARMIMMGLKLTNDVPFRTVFIHGLVRDAHGQKMSKSKGNVLDPLDIIEGRDLESLVAKMTQGLMQPEMAASIAKNLRREFPNGFEAYGTDTLRFAFAVMAGAGRDIAFDLGRLEGARAFCTKIWNAARFVLIKAEEIAHPASTTMSSQGTGIIDRWIESRFARAIEEVKKGVANFRLHQIAAAIYDFTWHEYCDWYLELSKVALAEQASSELRAGTRATLLRTLEGLLRLIHPIMPFLSEELWQSVAPLTGVAGKSIMVRPYPNEHEFQIDEAAEAEIAWLQRIVGEIRRIRAEMEVPHQKKVVALLSGGNEQIRVWAARHGSSIVSLARLSSLEWLPAGKPDPEAAIAIVDEVRILLPMKDLVERDAELRRITKTLEELDRQLAKSIAKLANPDFLARAPANVVEQERKRLASARRELSELQTQKERVESKGWNT